MTDRLCDMVVATSRHAGLHALDDGGVEQVGRTERLPGAEPISSSAVVRARGRSTLAKLAPSTTRPVVVPRQLPVRWPAASLACLNPITSVSSACVIWDMATSQTAEAIARSPFWIASATSASATVTSSSSSPTQAASFASATVTTGTVFVTLVPFL